MEDFDSYYFPRQKSKSIQGGGTVVLVRRKFHKFVTFVNNQYDTIIWLKIQGPLCSLNSDLYLGCVYIPPNNSSFHRVYNCDIFNELESQITTYLAKGKVMLLGDINARTSNRDDFIFNDFINCDILSEVIELLTYEIDKPLPVRINPDKVVNEYGSKLLSLCKSSGLRILNGRHKHALDRDYTFCGGRGLSVVDYFISTPDIFDITEKFIVSSFTTFSDHAPLHVELQCSMLEFEKPTVESDLHTSRKCRWNPDYYDEAKGVLLSCLENLNITSESVDVECQNTIDTAVDQFTSQLSKAFEPFFEIKIKPVNKHRKTAYSTVTSIDKPWWTAEAQRKYNTYRRDLFLFNRNKTINP